MAKRTSSTENAVSGPCGPGELVIRDTVLEEIAFAEAMGTPGVVPPREGLVRGILRRHKPRGVQVEAAGQEVAFHLTFGVSEGERIPDVADEVRRRVAEAVGIKTGYVVRGVNVLVDHVEFDKGR